MHRKLAALYNSDSRLTFDPMEEWLSTISKIKKIYTDIIVNPSDILHDTINKIAKYI